MATYYLLWRYARETFNGQDKYLSSSAWHHRNALVAVSFVCFRFVLYGLVTSSCLVQALKLNLWTIFFQDLSFSTKMLLFCMGVSLVIAAAFAAHLCIIHRTQSRVYIKSAGELLVPVSHGELFSGEHAVQATRRLNRIPSDI